MLAKQDTFPFRVSTFANYQCCVGRAAAANVRAKGKLRLEKTARRYTDSRGSTEIQLMSYTGAEPFMHSLLSRLQFDLAMSTSSLNCLRLDPALRKGVADVLVPTSKIKVSSCLNSRFQSLSNLCVGCFVYDPHRARPCDHAGQA